MLRQKCALDWRGRPQETQSLIKKPLKTVLVIITGMEKLREGKKTINQGRFKMTCVDAKKFLEEIKNKLIKDFEFHSKRLKFLLEDIFQKNSDKNPSEKSYIKLHRMETKSMKRMQNQAWESCWGLDNSESKMKNPKEIKGKAWIWFEACWMKI